jgi:pilus assembly protein Flp/PilA
MVTMNGLLKNFIKDDSGATAIEYALISAIVGIGIIAVLSQVRGGIADEFNATAAALADANQGG